MEGRENGPAKQTGNTFLSFSYGNRASNCRQVENVTLEDRFLSKTMRQMDSFVAWKSPINSTMSEGGFELSCWGQLQWANWLCAEISLSSIVYVRTYHTDERFEALLPNAQELYFQSCLLANWL